VLFDESSETEDPDSHELELPLSAAEQYQILNLYRSDVPANHIITELSFWTIVGRDSSKLETP
jgi:hypothetical protein